MKKTLRILVLMAIVSLFAVTKSKAQISVHLQLTRPPQYEANERNHPNQPGPNYVWIAEEWQPNGNGGYDYKPGFWVQPPQLVWVPGHWQQRGGGYIWMGGHWSIFVHGHWAIIKEQ